MMTKGLLNSKLNMPASITRYLGIVFICLLSLVLSACGMTPEEAVNKAVKDGKLQTVLELYDKTDNEGKQKIGYEITKCFYAKVLEAYKTDEDKDHQMQQQNIKNTLESSEINPSKRPYLRPLVEVKRFCQGYQSTKNSLDKFTKELSANGISAKSVRDGVSNVIEKLNVFIIQKIDEKPRETYIATDYDSIPTGYVQFGSNFYVSSTQALPNINGWVAYIQTYGKDVFRSQGVYTFKALKTGSKEVTTINGFKQTVPIYHYIPDNMENTLFTYKKVYDSYSWYKKALTETNSKIPNLLEKTYAGKNNLTEIKIDGKNLNSSQADFETSYTTTRTDKERAGIFLIFNNGMTVLTNARTNDSDLKILEIKVLKGAANTLQTSNGISIGTPTSDMKTKMNDYLLIYGSDNAKSSTFVYLLPDGTVAYFKCEQDKVQEIGLEYNDNYYISSYLKKGI